MNYEEYQQYLGNEQVEEQDEVELLEGQNQVEEEGDNSEAYDSESDIEVV